MDMVGMDMSAAAVVFALLLVSSTAAATSLRRPAPRVPPPAGYRRRSLEELRAAAPGADGAEEPFGEPEILELPAKCAGASTLGVVVVPGNPGIPHFYCDFGTHLQESLAASGEGDAAVYILGYTNFPTDVARKGPVAPIREEAERLGPVLGSLAHLHRQEGLLVIGQSIGAWCVLQHLREAAEHGSGHLGGAKVPLAVLATPYLEYDPDPEGAQGKLKKFLRLPFANALVRFLATCFTSLPLRVQQAMAPYLSYSGHDTVLETFGQQPHHLESWAFMGLTEFFELDPRLPAKSGEAPGGFAALQAFLRSEKRPQVFGLFAERDIWFPTKHREKFEGLALDAGSLAVPRVETVTLEDLEHSFVLHSEQSSQVADLIAARLREVREGRPA